jgi:mRNA interferase RelE/StbE
MTRAEGSVRKTYAKKAVKDIKRIGNPDKQRIKKGIEELPGGDVRKLKGHDNLYRLRIGDWRIIFSYAEKAVILIEEVEPRGDVYK